jgi:hypothetical protein
MGEEVAALVYVWGKGSVKYLKIGVSLFHSLQILFGAIKMTNKKDQLC